MHVDGSDDEGVLVKEIFFSFTFQAFFVVSLFFLSLEFLF